MNLSGDGRRLQTCGGLTAQLFDSTLRTLQLDIITIRKHLESAPQKSRRLSKIMLHKTQRGSLPLQLKTLLLFVCMNLSGDGRRLQTCGGLTAQLFDSTLRTSQLDLIIFGSFKSDKQFLTPNCTYIRCSSEKREICAWRSTISSRNRFQTLLLLW